MIDVLALGEVLIDFTMTASDESGYPTMAAHPGGAPANFLAAVAKQGGKAAILGKVGTDAFGAMLKRTLEEAGILTRGLLMADDVFTTLAFVTLDASGDRNFSFARKPGADTRISFADLDLKLLEETKVFHFGTLSLTDEPARSATQQAVAYAKAHGKLVSFDPNLRPPLWHDLAEAKEQMLWGLQQADIVKISDEEIEFLFGLDAQQGAEKILQDYGVKLVFATCGARGCWFQNAVSSGMVPALSGIRVLDTTGAGDIFGGTAVWKVLETGKAPEALTEEELRKITVFACTAAGLSTTRPGGISSVPGKDEVLARI